MSTLKKDCRIASLVLQFALLLWAVTPVAYRIDWLFYTLFGLIVLCSAVLLFYLVRISHRRKDQEENVAIVGDGWDLLHYGMISIVGVIITFAMGDRLVWAWLIFLLLFIIDFVAKVWKPRQKK